MGFRKGNKLGKGGKRTPPGGRPTRDEVEVRRIARKKWEKELGRNAQVAAKKYFKEVLKDKGMLRDYRKTIVPDAKQQIEITGDFKVKVRQEVIDRIVGRENNDL